MRDEPFQNEAGRAAPHPSPPDGSAGEDWRAAHHLLPVAGTAAPSLAYLPPDQLGSGEVRASRLQITPTDSPHNPLWTYHRTTGGYLPVLRNAALIWLARYVAFPSLKCWLYRRVGVRVGGCVSVGLMVMLDIFFPQDITLGDDCTIGYHSVLLCHEYLRHEWRRGPVWVGHDVTIGANTTVLPGVVIGDGAVVSAMSLVNRDVPPGAMVGGVPIRLIRPGKGQSSG
jgi:acetyltransferase-like isoleucine patch superfamily enzyme